MYVPIVIAICLCPPPPFLSLFLPAPSLSPFTSPLHICLCTFMPALTSSHVLTLMPPHLTHTFTLTFTSILMLTLRPGPGPGPGPWPMQFVPTVTISMKMKIKITMGVEVKVKLGWAHGSLVSLPCPHSQPSLYILAHLLLCITTLLTLHPPLPLFCLQSRPCCQPPNDNNLWYRTCKYSKPRAGLY